MRLGAFGWAMHFPRSSNENRVAKRRPCVVVMERGSRFVVLFGRSEPQHPRNESISETSLVGRRWGLENETYFHAEPQLLTPEASLECRGFFLTALPDGVAPDPDTVEAFDLWLRLRGLVSRG